jgi:predicted TIM-barrel enzyme
MSLDDAVDAVQAMADAAWEVRPDMPVICHGGPIASIEDTRYVLSQTRGLAGFYGASSMERLPVEIAITDNIRGFKQLSLNA